MTAVADPSRRTTRHPSEDAEQRAMWLQRLLDQKDRLIEQQVCMMAEKSDLLRQKDELLQQYRSGGAALRRPLSPSPPPPSSRDHRVPSNAALHGSHGTSESTVAAAAEVAPGTWMHFLPPISVAQPIVLFPYAPCSSSALTAAPSGVNAPPPAASTGALPRSLGPAAAAARCPPLPHRTPSAIQMHPTSHTAVTSITDASAADKTERSTVKHWPASPPRFGERPMRRTAEHVEASPVFYAVPTSNPSLTATTAQDPMVNSSASLIAAGGGGGGEKGHGFASPSTSAFRSGAEFSLDSSATNEDSFVEGNASTAEEQITAQESEKKKLANVHVVHAPPPATTEWKAFPQTPLDGLLEGSSAPSEDAKGAIVSSSSSTTSLPSLPTYHARRDTRTPKEPHTDEDAGMRFDLHYGQESITERFRSVVNAGASNALTPQHFATATLADWILLKRRSSAAVLTPDDAETVRRVVENGANVTYRDATMDFPLLSQLIWRNQIELVQLCFQSPHPIDFTAVDRSGLTPLHWVPSAGKTSAQVRRLLHLVLDRLEAHPEDVVRWGQKSCNGMDCLSYAACYGHLSVWWRVVKQRRVPYYDDAEGGASAKRTLVIACPVFRKDWLRISEEDRSRFQLAHGFRVAEG